MSMKPLLLAMATLLATTTQAAVAANGENLTQQMCVSCHATQGKGVIAPPLFAVVNHVKKRHNEKAAFIDYVVNWVGNPQADKTLMPGAVKKFGLMPKLPYAEADLRLIAEYMYDSKFAKPKGYDKHYQAEHGSH